MTRCRDNRLHTAIGVEATTKRDAFTIRCDCGATEMVGTWYDKAPRGWRKTGWEEIRKAGLAVSEAWFGHALPDMLRRWRK